MGQATAERYPGKVIKIRRPDPEEVGRQIGQAVMREARRLTGGYGVVELAVNVQHGVVRTWHVARVMTTYRAGEDETG